MTTTIPRLRSNQWLDAVNKYRNAISERSQHDRESRGLKVTIESLREKIKGAMGDSRVAYCGNWVLTAAASGDVPATITTTEGQFGLGDVETIVLKDGRKISGKDIVTVFGGRCGYETLAVDPISK